LTTNARIKTVARSPPGRSKDNAWGLHNLLDCKMELKGTQEEKKREREGKRRKMDGSWCLVLWSWCLLVALVALVLNLADSGLAPDPAIQVRQIFKREREV
jgi:hypothetical protein